MKALQIAKALQMKKFAHLQSEIQNFFYKIHKTQKQSMAIITFITLNSISSSPKLQLLPIDPMAALLVKIALCAFSK